MTATVSTYLQILATRTELEERVSDLQRQLINSHEDLAKMRDKNQQLRDQLSTQEAKLVRVRSTNRHTVIHVHVHM